MGAPVQTFATAPQSHVRCLEPGDSQTLDFGNRQQPGSIRGTIWREINRDGHFGDDEPGLGGWLVYLDLNDNGELDAGESTAETQQDNPFTNTVNESGQFIFSSAHCVSLFGP